MEGQINKKIILIQDIAIARTYTGLSLGSVADRWAIVHCTRLSVYQSVITQKWLIYSSGTIMKVDTL